LTHRADQPICREMTESPDPARRTNRRAHFIETLLQAILHSAEDGNPTKIRQMIDTLYALGTMPITRADVAAFEWAYNPPPGAGDWYVMDARRLDWLAEQGLPHAVLRRFDFAMADVALPDPAAEAAFRARWCGGPGPTG